MRGIFGEYTERTQARGRNLKERYEKDTDRFIMESFENSPTYREIKVYEKGVYKGIKGVRVNMIERMGNIRNLLLKPGDDLWVGNMAKFEERDWILYDKFGYHEVGVKMTAMRTNHVLKWKSKDGGLWAIKCYASSSDIGSKSKQSRANIEYNKYDVKLPYGQLYIFIESSEASAEIDLNHRFIINGIAYEVVGLDNTTHVENNYGLIQFTVKRTTRHPKDNFKLGIAHNNYSIEESNIIKVVKDVEVEEDEGRGGKIW